MSRFDMSELCRRLSFTGELNPRFPNRRRIGNYLREPQLWISDIFHFDLFSSEHVGREAGYDVDECVCW